MVGYLKRPIFISTIICLIIFYSGLFKIPQKNPLIYNGNLKDINQITGFIYNSPVKSGTGKTYYSEIELYSVKNSVGAFQTKGLIKIYIPSEMIEAYYPGKLYSSGYKKSLGFYETGGLYTFNGNYTENCFVVFECIGYSWPKTFFGKLDWFRAVCRLKFKRLLYAWNKAGGLLLALLCGAREYTDETISFQFKRAGLSHILALSGMHLSMFSSIAIFFGSKIGRKKLTFIIRFIVLILFVWFAGFSPSLLRAFICAILVLLSTISNVNQPDMVLILCTSFLIQSIISPADISNAGFQLSYGALLGILLLNKQIYKKLCKIMPGYFAASFSSSSSANLFTAPISIKLFGSFSPIGIIATTFVSPLVTIFIYTGLSLIVLCLLFPALVVPSGIFMNFQYTIIQRMVGLFAKVPPIQF